MKEASLNAYSRFFRVQTQTNESKGSPTSASNKNRQPVTSIHNGQSNNIDLSLYLEILYGFIQRLFLLSKLQFILLVIPSAFMCHLPGYLSGIVSAVQGPTWIRYPWPAHCVVPGNVLGLQPCTQ